MSAASVSTELKSSIEAAGGKSVSVPAPVDLAKAAALTQAAIEGLGGPVYASMTDHKIVDGALAKAMTDIAIQKGGIKSVDATKAPVDRAISEAMTQGAIKKGVTLKKTETTEKVVDLKALQAASQAEKDAKVAARTFGGGDAKAGMGNILKAIEGQGGPISVPAGKAPADNVSLSHAKALMEINALKGEAIFASGTDGKVEDKGLTQAKMLLAINAKGVTAADSNKIKKVEDRAANEAKTIMALGTDKKASLKSVAKPAEGLTKEQLASLQKIAEEEKKA